MWFPGFSTGGLDDNERERETERQRDRERERAPLIYPVEKDIGKTKKTPRKKNLDTSLSSQQLALLGSSMQNTRSISD